MSNMLCLQHWTSEAPLDNSVHVRFCDVSTTYPPMAREYQLVGITIYILWVRQHIIPAERKLLTSTSGFGAGMGNTAVFVNINAIVEPAHKAVAASGLFLSMPIGMIAGIAVTSALMLEVMKQQLDESLVKLGLRLVERQEVSPVPRTNNFG